MTTQTKLVTPIGEAEYLRRRQTLLEHLDRDGKGFVWWGNAPIFYLSGFSFVPTERPIALLLNRAGEAVLLVPRLELEHAQAYAFVDRVETYPEYPDERHPLEHLSDLLEGLKMDKGQLFGDGDGYGKVMGYRGPKLSELLEVEVEFSGETIDEMMYVKSEHEVALIAESARWAGRAHRLLQDYTKVGANESDVSERASFDANRELLAEYGGTYRALAWGRSGPGANYRGQVGEHSALPHSLTINAVFKEGDTLVTGASCPMFGYYSELERTMFVGEPSEAQRRYFGHMLALQDLAIDLCRAGEPCANVDKAVRAYFERNDLMDNWRHHTGHNIGIRYHEGPFLDIGDGTVMEPGMLFTVEPGVYVPGLGGFRHSDTILVTEGEPEFLTEYPRALDDLIIPV